MRSGVRGAVISPYGRIVVVCLAVVAAVALLLVSPLALSYLGAIPGTDWAKLSDVAQALGAAATLVSTLALGGVAVSLVMQSRDNKMNREQARRGFHLDLYAMALDDPSLLECWGEVVPPTYSHGQHRQHVYVNQIVSFWSMLYKVDELPADELRQLAAALFAGAPGRRYWSVAGPHRKALRGTRRTREFVLIIDDEYTKAVGSDTETAETVAADEAATLA